MKKFSIMFLSLFILTSWSFSAKAQEITVKDGSAMGILVIEDCIKAGTSVLECVENKLLELGSIAGIKFNEIDSKIKIIADEIEANVDKESQKEALYLQAYARLLAFGKEEYKKTVFLDSMDRAKILISESKLGEAEDLKKLICLSYIRFCASLTEIYKDSGLYGRLVSDFNGLQMDYNQVGEEYRSAIHTFQSEYEIAYNKYKELHSKKKQKHE